MGNNEKKNIRVDLFDKETYCVPNNLCKFIKYLNSHLEEVPEQFKQDVMIDYSVNSDNYGEPVEELHCYYYREETDEEFQTRLTEQQERKEQEEAREREQLRILQEKYGG